MIHNTEMHATLKDLHKEGNHHSRIGVLVDGLCCCIDWEWLTTPIDVGCTRAPTHCFPFLFQAMATYTRSGEQSPSSAKRTWAISYRIFLIRSCFVFLERMIGGGASVWLPSILLFICNTLEIVAASCRELLLSPSGLSLIITSDICS